MREKQFRLWLALFTVGCILMSMCLISTSCDADSLPKVPDPIFPSDLNAYSEPEPSEKFVRKTKCEGWGIGISFTPYGIGSEKCIELNCRYTYNDGTWDLQECVNITEKKE